MLGFSKVRHLGLALLESVGIYDANEAERKIAIDTLLQTKREAKTYEEWQDCCRDLDALLGNDQWKAQEECDLYDHELVRFRLEQLRAARLDGDMEKLLLLVRTTLQRNLGNMGNPKLYLHCFSGTKQLIEDYICECELALETLLESNAIANSRLLATLIQTRKAFGRTALVLSGGSTFGALHIGVLYELLNAKLLPRIISGSSAGSIFASILCIHLDSELNDLLLITQREFDIFEETGREESTLVRITRFLKYGTWLDNKYLSTTMRQLLGDLTFQEAYYRTRRVLNVTVSPSSIHEMPKLLNYLTAPNVLIWSAVCASCSVPFVFASYDILAKHPKTGEHYSWSPSTFIDGSVDNDLPMARLSEMFNVNHFIACQVNPHVAPFLKLSEFFSGHHSEERVRMAQWTDLFSTAHNFINDELSHYLILMSELGIFKNTATKLRSVLGQSYSGDVTILPQIKWSEVAQLFKNPTREYIGATMVRSASATWSNIDLVRNHCATELCLDKTIHLLRTRLIQRPLSYFDLESHTHYHRHHHSYNKAMHHFRRKSDIPQNASLRASLSEALANQNNGGADDNANGTTNSNGNTSIRKQWSPSPPFMSYNSSHVSLYSLNLPIVARYRDSQASPGAAAPTMTTFSGVSTATPPPQAKRTVSDHGTAERVITFTSSVDAD